MVVLATIMGLAVGPATAGADGGVITTPPPPLLPSVPNAQIGIFGTTDAQYAALQNFQNQAIQNTLQDHGLPQSDATAVQTWGRVDAESALWLEFTDALSASACTPSQTPGNGCRTSDQQNVVDWLEAVDQREAVIAAQDAGLEYVKWAGLSESGWASLLASNPSQDQITNFLCGGSTCPVQPQDYAGAVSQCPTDGSACVNVNGTNYTQGFCVFTPPKPFQDKYPNDKTEPVCNGTPCPEMSACSPFGPSYDQLVQWGAADVQNKLYNTPAAADLARQVAIGFGFAAGAAAAITALSLSATLVPTATTAGLTATVGALAPFAATVGVGVASIAALIGIAIAGAIAVGFYAVQAFNAQLVPSQIATLIGKAENNPVNLDAVPTSNTDEYTGLYGLFVAAASPTPDPGTCQAGCLNAPPIPAASSSDPLFDIAQNTGTAANPTFGPANDSGTLSWKDTANSVTDSAYAVGNWFVESTTDTSNTTTTSQTLRIHYTDWNGNGHTAWLVDWPTVGTRFVSVKDQSSTGGVSVSCLTDGSCDDSSVIDYTGADGKLYRAAVINPNPVIGTLHVGSGPLVEGTPVQLSTAAFSSVGSPLTTTWTILDKPVNPPLKICTDPQQHQIPCPPPTVTVTGNPATFTFPTNGPFTVSATVTDAAGRTTSSPTITVNVAAVPPTVGFDPVCNRTSPSSICLGAVNQTINPPGTVTVLGGVIHAGSEDVESVSVDWGDGSPPERASNYGGCYTQGFLCDPNFLLGSQSQVPGGWLLPFTGTHDYSASGNYTVTVTTTDQAGGTSTAILPETILYPTQTTVADDIGPTVFGQSAMFTAAVMPTGAGSPSGPPTGTVQFYDGGTPIGIGTLSTVGGVTSATISTGGLSVSSGHSITAEYVSDGTYEGSQSSPVSHEVDRASTSTGLVSAPNPSVFGQSVTFTATVSVTNPGAGTPTGTVEFMDGSSDIPTCGSVTLGTNGQATCTTASLSVATHGVTATYSGDGSFLGSASATDSDIVNKASTSTQLGTSGPTVTSGQPLTITATVTATAPGAGTPTGTVRFLDGSTLLGTGALNGSGVATLTTSALTIGKHTLTVSYLGDPSFLSSSGGPTTEYVNTSLAKFPKLPSGAYNLAGANLAGAVLVGAQLQNASLVHANLLGAVLIGANLAGANLSYANLQSADLTGANLQHANLSYANLLLEILKSANLTGATTKGANFNSVVWGGTTCVDGTSSNAHGGTCVGHL